MQCHWPFRQLHTNFRGCLGLRCKRRLCRQRVGEGGRGPYLSGGVWESSAGTVSVSSECWRWLALCWNGPEGTNTIASYKLQTFWAVFLSILCFSFHLMATPPPFPTVLNPLPTKFFVCVYVLLLLLFCVCVHAIITIIQLAPLLSAPGLAVHDGCPRRAARVWRPRASHAKEPLYGRLWMYGRSCLCTASVPPQSYLHLMLWGREPLGELSLSPPCVHVCVCVCVCVCVHLHVCY